MSASSMAAVTTRSRLDAGRAAPGPRGWRLLRDLRDMRRDRLAVVMRAMREHGDVVQFRAGPRRLVLVSHPDAMRRVLVDNHENYEKGLGLTEARPLLGDGLLTSEGELWATRRRALQGAFHGPRLDGFAASVVGAAAAVADRWSRDGGPVDVGQDMLRLALVAFGAGLLNVDLSTRCDDLIRAFCRLEAWAMARSTAMLPWRATLPTPANLIARRAVATLEAFVDALLADRRARPPHGDDLVSVLLALDQPSDERSRASRDELLTFLLAGHETTGAALAWTWLCLAEHPESDARVYEELDGALDERMPCLADVGRLPYTRAAIEEAIRLYPPVWLIPRRAIGPDELCGYRIERRTDVLLSVYAMHRHPAFWPSPDEYDPTRFLQDPASVRASGAYLPFGAGPRSCLGSRLAITEAVLAIAVLARRFRPGRVSAATARPNPSLTLQFPHGFFMRAVPRRK